MTIAQALAQVEVDPAGDTVEGGWCEACLLPSMLAQTLLVRTPGQARWIPVVIVVCDDCGREALL